MLALKYRLERVSSSYIYEAEIYKFRIQMASFGACTSKPSYLYSQHACFQDGMLLQPVYARNFARILIPPKTGAPRPLREPSCYQTPWMEEERAEGHCQACEG